MGARVGAPTVRLEAENVKAGWPVNLDVASVRRSCKLVTPERPPIRGSLTRRKA